MKTLIAVLFIATTAIAQTPDQFLKDALIDPSGEWILEELKGPARMRIQVSSSTFVYNGNTFFHATGGEEFFGADLRGMAILERHGTYYVGWVRATTVTPYKPQGLDGESNLVRRTESDHFILGGDFEQEDLLKMSKVH
jgi:hypothetical protein